ncbi:Nab3p, partial [Reticulomyxa filosa]
DIKKKKKKKKENQNQEVEEEKEESLSGTMDIDGSLWRALENTSPRRESIIGRQQPKSPYVAVSPKQRVQSMGKLHQFGQEEKEQVWDHNDKEKEIEKMREVIAKKNHAYSDDEGDDEEEEEEDDDDDDDDDDEEEDIDGDDEIDVDPRGQVRRDQDVEDNENSSSIPEITFRHDVGIITPQLPMERKDSLSQTIQMNTEQGGGIWFRRNQQRIQLLRQLFTLNERGEDETLGYDQFIAMLKKHGVDVDAKALELKRIEQFFRQMTMNCNIPGTHNERNRQLEQDEEVANAASSSTPDLSKRKQSYLFSTRRNDTPSNSGKNSSMSAINRPKGQLDFATFLYYFGGPVEDDHIDATLKLISPTGTQAAAVAANASKKNSLSNKAHAGFDFSPPQSTTAAAAAATAVGLTLVPGTYDSSSNSNLLSMIDSNASASTVGTTGFFKKPKMSSSILGERSSSLGPVERISLRAFAPDIDKTASKKATHTVASALDQPQTDASHADRRTSQGSSSDVEHNERRTSAKAKHKGVGKETGIYVYIFKIKKIME